MGGRSSSSSSSSTTTNTTENHNETYAERDGTAVGSGATVDVVYSDYGVIEGAADVLEAGLSQMSGIVGNTVEAFRDITLDNNQILKEQQASDVKELGQTILQGLIVFGVVLMGLVYLVFRKR